MKHIYTSVDIGTDTTKVIVTELYKGKLNLLAASSTKSRGIKKGLITDVNEASLSLKKAISEVEEMLGFKIKKVLVNVPSYFSEFSSIFYKFPNFSGLNRGVNFCRTPPGVFHLPQGGPWIGRRGRGSGPAKSRRCGA